MTWLKKYPTIRDIMRAEVSIRQQKVAVPAVFALLFAVMLAAFPGVARAEAVAPVSQDPVVAAAVDALTDMGVLAGRDSASFVPDDPVTRGQLAGYLARAVGLAGSDARPFSDVAAGDWFAGSVSALYEAGLVTGTGPGAFSPDDMVTRQDAVAWIVAALGYRVTKDHDFVIPYRLPQVEQAGWLAGFGDRDMIEPQNRWAVANAYRLGITFGAVDGWFYPDLPLSRGQAAVMLHRAFVQPVSARTDAPEAVEAVASYPRLSSGSEGPLVQYLEERLASLRYCPGDIDGIYDEKTRDAVMAFEKVERLTRDGVVGDKVWERLFVAQTPAPHVTADGYRIEVDLSRQVLMLVDNNSVWKIVHVSTGKKGTRTGHYTIGSKIEGWVKLVTLDGYFYYPSYVVSRTAIHGYPSVPAWPASHGCVRVPMWMAKELFFQVPTGTPIDIYYS